MSLHLYLYLTFYVKWKLCEVCNQLERRNVSFAKENCWTRYVMDSFNKIQFLNEAADCEDLSS